MDRLYFDMGNNEKKTQSNEENFIGHEGNLPTLREGNLDSFPETNKIKAESFNYKKEDNVKSVKEDNSFTSSKDNHEATDDQKGGNLLSKSSFSTVSKITLTLASAVTAVVAVVAVVPKTTSPTISGLCSFLDGTISCHLLLENPSAINLTFSIKGKTNGFSYSEPLYTVSSSSESNKGIKRVNSSSYSSESSISSSSSEETLVTFDRDIDIPDYSNYDVYIKGNIGYGDTTYYHTSVTEENDSVSVTGDPYWDDDGSLKVDLIIDNPKDYDLTLNAIDSSTKEALTEPIIIPSGYSYLATLPISSSHNVSLIVKASKGYSSREVYYRSLSSRKASISNPYDLKAFFYDKYLVYGLSLKTGEEAIKKTKFVINGIDNDYSFEKELTDASDYADTLTLDAAKSYIVELYGYSGEEYVLLTTSDALSSSPLLSSPKVVGMNRTLFLSYDDSSGTSYGDVNLNVYDEARTKLLGTYPFYNNTYCVLSEDGPYSYDISADFPNGGASATISTAVYSSSITTDNVQEPTITEDSRANEDTLYYSLTNAYTGSGSVLSATYTMYIYSSSTKEKVLAAIDLGTDPSSWTPGFKSLDSYSSYYYEVVASTSYGNKTYLSKSLTNETGLLSRVYGDVYAGVGSLTVDLTTTSAALGSNISITQNDGTSKYDSAIVDNAYRGSFSVEETYNPYKIEVSSDKIGGNEASLFSTSISMRNDIHISLNPAVREVPSKKLYYAFYISPDASGEKMTVTSKGMTSGTTQSQEITLEDPSSSYSVYSGSFDMGEEDQEVTLADATGGLIYYGVKEYRTDIVSPTISGATATLNSEYGGSRNIPVEITTISNPSKLPIEITLVPYDSTDTILTDYVQNSSIDEDATSGGNTDLMISTSVGVSYVIAEVRLNEYLGGDVYWQSDKLLFT